MLSFFNNLSLTALEISCTDHVLSGNSDAIIKKMVENMKQFLG